jgi:hypothetical protein
MAGGRSQGNGLKNVGISYARPYIAGSLDVVRELSMNSGCQLAAAQLYELNLHSYQHQLAPTSGAAV